MDWPDTTDDRGKSNEPKSSGGSGGSEGREEEAPGGVEAGDVRVIVQNTIIFWVIFFIIFLQFFTVIFYVIFSFVFWSVFLRFLFV